MSWYNDDTAFNDTKDYGPRRFWMPNNSERKITIVDAPNITLNGVQIKTPFQFQEYNIQLNGHWRNWFTRHPNASEDLLAEMGHKASRVAVFTVIDHNEYTDKKGVVHKDKTCIYVIKRSLPIFSMWERAMARFGSLQGKTFLISRMGDKSSGCGSVIERVEDWQGFNPSTHQPLNYLDLFAPKSREELTALVGNADQGDSNGAWGGGSSSMGAPQQSAPQQGGGSWNAPTQGGWNAPQQSAPQQGGWNNQQNNGGGWNGPPPPNGGWGNSDSKVPF